MLHPMKMELLNRFVVFVVLFMGFGTLQSYGSARRPQPALWRGGGAAMTKYQTIVVDQSGNGNYTTIQAAIDAIPTNNMQWICVYVKEGTYKYSFIYLFIFIYCYCNYVLLDLYIIKVKVTITITYDYVMLDKYVVYKLSLG